MHDRLRIAVPRAITPNRYGNGKTNLALRTRFRSHFAKYVSSLIFD